MPTRRTFLNQSGVAATSLVLPWIPSNLSSLFENQITFGMVADIHQDIMLDAEARLEVFIEATNERKTDFNIQLGDFCEPKQTNLPFLNIWNQYKGPKYHVLGNHDMDSSTKEGTLDFWSMEKKYYSFDANGFHFVVLDANYLYLEHKFVDYSKANFYIDDSHRTWINPEQIEWLKEDLVATNSPTIVFSHQGLATDAWGVKNRTVVQKVLEEANKNAGFNKVIACFNGHNHIDTHRTINGIHYIDVNSMSYHWLGEKYKCFTRYDKSMYEERPILSMVAPYEAPLFGMVTIKNGALIIEGMSGKYIGPSPEDLGRPKGFYGVDPTPNISSRTIEL